MRYPFSFFGTKRGSQPTRRRPARKLIVERLEDRALLAYDFGYAFALGTSLNDNAGSIAANSAGNVGVIGNYSLGTLPSEPLDLDPGAGTYLLPSGEGSDKFVAQYDVNGHLLGGLRITSATSFAANEASMDEAGNLFVAGWFNDRIDFVQPGTAPVTLTETAAGHGGFLAKIDPAGSVLWARTLSDGGINWVANGISVDGAGKVYATGNSSDIHVPGQPAAAYHLHVDKIDGSSGASVWSRVVSGGTGISWAGYYTNASGIDVAVDADGHIHVVGTFMGDIDFNPDPNQTDLLFSFRWDNPFINDDVFVLELDAAGGYVWAGSMPSPGQWDMAGAIAADGTGNVYVSGSFDNQTGDADPGPGTMTLPSGAYLVKLDANHQVLWGMSGVGGNFEGDAAGNFYQSGSFSGTFDADPGPGTFNLASAGSNDVYVRKLDSDGNFVWAGAMGGPASDLSPANPIARDGQGNLYTAGSFQLTADFDPGTGTYSLTSTPDANGNPSRDAFVLKLIPTASPPAAPSLRISDVTVSEGNAGTVSAAFTVSLSAAMAETVVVSYATANGTATAGSDYVAEAGTLTFAPGETSKTITLRVNGDRSGELNESFVINLSNAINAAIADGQAEGTIVDDEPRISITDVTKAEGKKGQTTLFTFTVTLSAAYDQPVTMSFSTANGTATTGNNDYIAKTDTLTFAPGETTKTITIEIKGDRNREANEMFYLDLFGLSSNALFTKNRGIGTILNDD